MIQPFDSVFNPLADIAAADRVITISCYSNYFILLDMCQDTAITVAESANYFFYRISIVHGITPVLK
jgi:hypothetical protein